MKYIVAIIGGLVVFIGVGIVANCLLSLLVPKLHEISIELGAVSGDMGGLIALLIASLAATASLKASLSGKGKTGRLYKKKTQEDSSHHEGTKDTK